MVSHYRKTAPISERIKEQLAKNPEVVEVVEVSSDEENTEEEEEVTILLEKSPAGPVVGSSSDSSGRITLAPGSSIF